MAGAANRDAIGGDLCGTILAALRFNLPGEFFRSSGIRGQLFLNWGNVSSLADRRSVRETVSDFMRDYRCSMVSVCPCSPVLQILVLMRHIDAS